jgi:polysaccharide deacetylase
MNRREFAKERGIGAMSLTLNKTALPLSDEKSQIAIAIDDFNRCGAPPQVARSRNRALLNALGARSSLKAAAFPVGRNIDSELGTSLVREWGEEGHLICNHTCSHWFNSKRGRQRNPSHVTHKRI